MQPALHEVETMSKLVIPVKNVVKGSQSFDFKVDKSFIDEFGNDFVLDTDCDVHVDEEKKGSWIEVLCKIKGKVVVECDRCLDPLALDVDQEELLVVRFDSDPETVEEDDDNVLILSEDETELDLGQVVYDYICLSVPIFRVHPDGQCNPDMLARLKAMAPAEPADNAPFSGLEDLLNNK